MDAAEIGYQDTVNEYPYIIISNEVKLHFFAGVIIHDDAVFWLFEINRHVQAEKVIDPFCLAGGIAGCNASIRLYAYYIGRAIKREKLPHIAPVIGNGRYVIDVKAAAVLIRLDEFRIIISSVIYIIPVFFVEDSIYVLIRILAILAEVRIKQISK